MEVLPLKIEGDIRSGDRLENLIIQAIKDSAQSLYNGDIVVVGHKVVSKSEGRTVDLSNVNPSAKARRIAEEQKKDPRVVELIIRESKEIVAMTRGVIISQTRHGWVCANAGVDLSNTEKGNAILLPTDPDKSASELRKSLSEKSGADIAVVISDTFGRAFRNGQTNVAIGVSGIEPIKSYIGTRDMYGNELRVTEIAVADEIAAAAELVMGKADSIPVAIVRGYGFHLRPRAHSNALIRAKRLDIFRQMAQK